MANMLDASTKNFGSIREDKGPIIPLTKKTYKFNWFIPNFRSYIGQCGKYDESPYFYSGANKEYKWSLDICMAGCDRHSQDYIGIRLYPFSWPPDNNAKFATQLSILDDKGARHATKRIYIIDREAFIQNFILKKDILNNPKLLPNDELRISCEIFDLSNKNEDIEMQHFQNSQLEVVKTLFEKRKFSDFKLVVKGYEFEVHRAILAVQSPVFEAMFDNNMREASEGKAHIDDIEPKVMRKLLNFIYTGKIDAEDLTDKVLVAAEKYQLDSLKLRCENELAMGLSVDNVYEILLFADQNNAVNLKEKALEFFDKNLKTLRAVENFKTLINCLSGDLKTEIVYILAMNAM